MENRTPNPPNGITQVSFADYPVDNGTLMDSNASQGSCIRHHYDATQDLLGDGLLIEIIHCSPDLKDAIPSGTKVSYRFFPDKIQDGMIYSPVDRNAAYSEDSLDSFLSSYNFSDCEDNDVSIMRVRDFTWFKDYNYMVGDQAGHEDNDVRFLTNDQGFVRALVRVTHRTGNGIDNRVARQRQWIEEGPFINGSQLDAMSAWRASFFTKFPGVNCRQAKTRKGTS